MKFKGTLPQGDADGLSAIAPAMVAHPGKFHVIMAVIDTSSVTTNFDTGDTEPTARIRRVEVIPAGDADTAEQLMRRAMERRTGATVLPIDLEDELAAMFSDVDTSTGELLSPAPEDTDDTGEDN